MINYSLRNPEMRVKVLHFIKETHSSENTLDLGELTSHPLCGANSPGGQGPPSRLSSVSSSVKWGV